MSRKLPIGIFDSGFGGLTVMRAIRTLLPHENIIYFADTARLPYGTKSPKTIIQYSKENGSFLKDQGIKLLVIACHTSSSVATEHLEQIMDVPIVEMISPVVEHLYSLHLKVGEFANAEGGRFASEPAQAAIEKLGPGRVGCEDAPLAKAKLQLSSGGSIAQSRLHGKRSIVILGTHATISSGKLQTHIQSTLPHTKVVGIACQLLVPLIEEGFVEHPLVELALQEYLRPLKANPVDTLLLGCTHFPLVTEQIRKEVGPSVRIVDPAISCAEAVKITLVEKNLLNPEQTTPQYQFFVSDNPKKFQLLGKNFLNYPLEKVKEV